MVVTLPAMSVAVPVSVPTPSVEITLVPVVTPLVFAAPPLVGWQPPGVAIPEPAAPLTVPLGSEQAKVIVRLVTCQLFRPSGAGGAFAVMLGTVKSILIGPKEVVAMLPALSCALPV